MFLAGGGKKKKPVVQKKGRMPGGGVAQRKDSPIERVEKWSSASTGGKCRKKKEKKRGLRLVVCGEKRFSQPDAKHSVAEKGNGEKRKRCEKKKRKKKTVARLKSSGPLKGKGRAEVVADRVVKKRGRGSFAGSREREGGGGVNHLEK